METPRTNVRLPWGPALPGVGREVAGSVLGEKVPGRAAAVQPGRCTHHWAVKSTNSGEKRSAGS